MILYMRIFAYFSNVMIIMLAAFSGKCNALVWRPSIRLSVCPIFFPTLIRHATHTQRDLSGVSTRRDQRTFPSDH